ncbi:hypothetical protein [Phenylobacterium sp.]|uniref:hypothetical protein n=1 Tax=Phenylobacterium sp. TaxID=1871053 RepID=UPI002EDBB743
MDRLSKLTLALAALALAPLPALAQSRTAAVVASAPRMAAGPAQAFVIVEHDPRLLRRSSGLPPTEPRAKLRLSSAAETPEVSIRPKDEWREDEGLRVSPARVAFKRRF